MATNGFPTVVQKMPKINEIMIGAVSILKADLPADLIITNSDDRAKFKNVVKPANIITNGIASNKIDGHLSAVLLMPANIFMLLEAMKFN